MSTALKETQISAVVSKDTKRLLDQLVRSTGLKKGYVVEMALRHHLEALQALPADVITPPRVVVSPRSWKDIVERLQKPPAPTQALRDLMAEKDGD